MYKNVSAKLFERLLNVTVLLEYCVNITVFLSRN